MRVRQKGSNERFPASNRSIGYFFPAWYRFRKVKLVAMKALTKESCDMNLLLGDQSKQTSKENTKYEPKYKM
jgi:hypothetical protein